jgi:hypothetical protein
MIQRVTYATGSIIIIIIPPAPSTDAKASLGIFLPLNFDGAGQPRPDLRCGLDRDLDVMDPCAQMIRSDLEVGHHNLILVWPLCFLFIVISCRQKVPSHVFGGTYDLSSDLCPVNARIHGFVHQAADHYVVTSNHVESMRCFRALFRVVLGSDHAFDGFLEDEVGDLIARHERAY